MKRYYFVFFTFIICISTASAQISNASVLDPFIDKLNKNTAVTQMVFIGDSHTQAGWLTAYLRRQFQRKYGNAGRGLVFPYAIANSNGADDTSSYSNTTWETFRLVYDQDVFSQMGITGFVMGNHAPSIIEINLQPEDAFNQVIIFNDKSMAYEPFEILDAPKSLKHYIQKDKKITSITVESGVTFPELAAKSYTTTTRLHALNKTKPYHVGTTYKTELTHIVYDKTFEKHTEVLQKATYGLTQTHVYLPQEKHQFVLKTNAKNGNVLYGFQFLNNNNNGMVFNTIGVNGATYGDFLKYPLQMQQIQAISPDIVIIALGTNESLSQITEDTFKDNAQKVIKSLRKNSPHLPILLISPADNIKSSNKISFVNQWIQEVASIENVAYLDLHALMGGKGYFKKALQRREANKDGVHFLKQGYEKQAQKIYDAIDLLIQKSEIKE